MKIIVLAIAIYSAVSGAAGAAAMFDVDAAERRINTLAAQIGRIDALAVVCELRDGDWADALESEFVLDATLPDVNLMSTEAHAKESQFANDALDRNKELALAEFTRVGARAICPGLKRDPNLARADKMVKSFRAPHDWSGAGGIK